MNVQDINVSQPPDWRPTREEVAQIQLALHREAYPPAARTRIGTVLRRVS